MASDAGSTGLEISFVGTVPPSNSRSDVDSAVVSRDAGSSFVERAPTSTSLSDADSVAGSTEATGSFAGAAPLSK